MTPTTADQSRAGQPAAHSTQLLPTQIRAASVDVATFNEADRTVEVVWTTGARVRRYDYWTDQSYDEELVVTAEAVDMSRLASGSAPVLNTHRQYDLESQIGVVQSASIANGEGRAVLRLSGRPELAGLVQDIKDGILRNISVGYNVQRYEVINAANRTDGGTVPIYRAVAWQPAELSFVPVPADAGSGTRSQPSAGGKPTDATPQGLPCEFIGQIAQPNQEHRMDPIVQTPAGEANTPTASAAPAATAAAPVADTRAADLADVATRAADITDLCTRHNVPALAADLIRSGKTVDQARAAVLDEMVRLDAAAGGHRNVQVQTVTDQMDVRMAGVATAMLHRLDPKVKLDDNARQFRGMSLLELGRDVLESQGVNTRGLDKLGLATRMMQFRSASGHTSGDFPSLLSNLANKRLRNAYDENAGTYTVWARRAPNAPDFKDINVVQLSGAPDLLRTNEHGEFKYGTMTDAGEKYQVITFGRIVNLTRQAIVNDDLRGFDRLVTAYGFSARRLENRLVYSQLTANANLGDGKALFHADHGNNATGAPSALAFAGLKAGRAAMRLQKGLQGEELNIVPAYLIVPATLEQDAYQLTSNNYVPQTQANVNEFRTGGRTALTPVVEPILDANSLTAWYLASDSGQIDTVEYCYLDGAEGPVIESEMGFEVDGISWKCRLDFATKAIDHRGLYRGVGA